MGFFNVFPDADGVLRRSLLVVPFDRSEKLAEAELYGSLEVQTIRLYLGVPSEQLTVNYNQTGIVSLQFGDKLQVKPDSIGRMAINYRGPERTYPYYSIVDVVQRKLPRRNIQRQNCAGGSFGHRHRGSAHSSLRRHHLSRSGSSRQRHRQHAESRRAEAWRIQELWDIAADSVFWHPGGDLDGAGNAAVDVVWAEFYCSAAGGGLRGVFARLVAELQRAGADAGLQRDAGLAVSRVGGRKRKTQDRTAFGQYLSPEVIRRLLLNPQLVEPRKTEITVMFSDIRGFTTISEKLDAQDLAIFLNQYLSDMTSLVFDTRGTLDKYIGDAVMAFWGAPFEVDDHAVNGCNSALRMMERVRDMQREWQAQGKAQTGHRHRVEQRGRQRRKHGLGAALRLHRAGRYGESVVAARRAQQGLRHAHHRERDHLRGHARDGNFVYRELDVIRVKGKSQPVTIYELIGRKGEASVYGSARGTAAAPGAICARAKTLPQRGAGKKRNERFKPCWIAGRKTDLRACTGNAARTIYSTSRPSGWDGVFTMTHK